MDFCVDGFECCVLLYRFVFKITCCDIVDSAVKNMNTLESTSDVVAVMHNSPTTDQGEMIRIRLSDIDLSSSEK